MKRLALLLALAAPLAPAAHAQDAETDWADAYRLVLVRDWPAADSALAVFASRYPADANAARAAFWRCYAVEQMNRADAADCYRRVAEAESDGRWKNEARTRYVALSARPARAGTPLTIATVNPVSVKTVTEAGKTHTLVLQTRPDGSVDTLTSTVVGTSDAYAFAWNGETGRLRGEAARLHGEAQRMQGEAQRRGAEAQRLYNEAQRAHARQRTDLYERAREAQATAAELQREAADLQREAAEVEREAVEAMQEAAEAPRPAVTVCNADDCSARSWPGTWSIARVSADTLSPDERVAVLAVEALGQSGQDESVDDLRRLAGAGRTAALRGAALSALGRIGTERANRAVLDLAARNNGLSPDDYARLVLALQRIAEQPSQTAEAVAALERIGRIPGLRVAAIQTIGQIEGPAALAALWHLADDAALDRSKTSAALAYLAVRSDTDADRLVGRLEALVRNDGDRQAVDALGRLQARSGAATRALERLAADADADRSVRLSALTALVHHPTETTVPLLVRLARDADTRLAHTAVQALGMLNTAEARRALLDLAQTFR